MHFGIVISICLAAIFLITMIVLVTINMIKPSIKMRKSGFTIQKHFDSIIKNITEEQFIECKYCRTKVDKSETNCPNCSAAIPIKSKNEEF